MCAFLNHHPITWSLYAQWNYLVCLRLVYRRQIGSTAFIRYYYILSMLIAEMAMFSKKTSRGFVVYWLSVSFVWWMLLWNVPFNASETNKFKTVLEACSCCYAFWYLCPMVQPSKSTCGDLSSTMVRYVFQVLHYLAMHSKTLYTQLGMCSTT
jgi:hypothetical protein